MADFNGMTLSEKYVTLLDSFWIKADWEELQGGYFRKEPTNIDLLFEFLEQFPANKELNVSVNSDLRHFLFNFEHFLFYFSYFGLWNIVIDEEKSQQISVNYHAAKSIMLTPLFKCLEEALAETWESKTNDMIAAFELLKIFSPPPIIEDIQDHLQEEKNQKESLFVLLKPLFEEGELNSTYSTYSNRKKTIVAGKYLFKVTLNNSCWCTVQLSESHTLLDLHELIQDALKFNDDHLYSFYMDGKKFSKNCYNSPMDSHGPFVNHVKIGSLHLYEGQRFLYLFDFGNEWEFYINVMKITEGIEGVSAIICDRKGDPPTQYDS
ncbi:IS1096 element passenger TnpR family protein [Bacillus sp. 03113]|uniref:IS1096 element passenger TnpR family protein n=1 Tax=Bacillus sp. 03113 TaxID=2578211 RepID=UPI0015E8BEED|nr:hypothetical protein [Bacillus sp. 03113]